MVVKRDFDKIYAEETDPWKIGSADSERYNAYLDQILKFTRYKKSILDIGCGFGAFLARFRNSFEKLAGVDVSREAVKKGKERFPFIEFFQGEAQNLEKTPLENLRFDVIILSDVIYYVGEKYKRKMLQWAADHLNEGGVAFIAAWVPGGHYLEYDELESLVRDYFKIEFQTLMPTKHGVFIASRKKYFIGITIDYETWHPIPPGKTIDWEKDALIPATKFLALAEDLQIKLTFFFEIGEYFWLRKNQPQTAGLLENQLKEVVQKGHDVQLHLHPSWLPELGADYKNGVWCWDWSKAKIADYPGDVEKVIQRCVQTLESILKPVNSNYRVTSFRAGAYQIQPFRNLFVALVKNGIFCDSSIYAGGVSPDRGHDFSLAFSDHQPYWANSYDPQLSAPPAERKIVELPIFTPRRGQRWFLDNEEGPLLASKLLQYLKKEKGFLNSEFGWRLRKNIQKCLRALYSGFKPLRMVLPKSISYWISDFRADRRAGHQYFVLIGHTKANHDLPAIRKNIIRLKEKGKFEFVTLTEMAKAAVLELSGPITTAERQTTAAGHETCNENRTKFLQSRIPPDRLSLLDLSCGAGLGSQFIRELYPWMKITRPDVGGDFSTLEFQDGEFDCICADHIFERSEDVDKTIKDCSRLLKEGGCLLALIPSDARNPRKNCPGHNWKTHPGEVEARLLAQGFSGIKIVEFDADREFGLPPTPPSNDKLMLVRAWKRGKEFTERDRVRELMNWIYGRLNPEQPQISNDPFEILKNGFAYCWGYAVTLGFFLKQENISVQWISMLAKNHPQGRGAEKIDSHEILEAVIGDKKYVLDPMANTIRPYSFEELIKNPSLAGGKENPDGRYLERKYSMYDTSFWYERIIKYARRNNYRDRIWFWEKNESQGR